MIESEVNIATPDGTADSYFAAPLKSSAPGVLIWTDIYGLRASSRQIAKRLAESGYAVLVPNPFYRVKKAPTAEHGTDTPLEQVRPISEHITETTQRTDAKAFIEWLDAQPSVAKNRKMGTIGYCFGGQLAFRTAAVKPDRMGAVASFHGGRLVTDQPNSPHLQAAQTHAQFLVAIAQNDDEKEPEAKTVLNKTFANAGVSAEIEVYPARHGWCVPDSKAYNQEQAERAWTRLVALFEKALA